MSENDPPQRGEAENRVDLSGLSRLSDQKPPPRGEKTVRVVRGLSILLLAIAAAGLPWYFVTRSGDEGKPSARSTSSSSPTPTASASPTPKAGSFEVFGLDKGVCLRIRKIPSHTAEILDCLGQGVRVSSDGKTQEAEGRLWRYVLDPIKKVWGWAADSYLKPV